MKKTVLILLFLIGFGLTQSMWVEPNYREFVYIYNEAETDTFFAACTTSAFRTDYYLGITTSEFYVVNPFASDSCLTVYVQYKNRGGDWGGHYSSTTNKTKLDTINRTLINTTGAYIYFDPAPQTGWLIADSTRFIYGIGTGDTLLIKNRVGGE